MQVQRISNNNYNPQFNGILKIQNFKKGGKVIERLTEDSVDKKLYESAYKNLFNGDWSRTGQQTIQKDKLSEYTKIIRQVFGIKLPETADKVIAADVKNLENGYRIKFGNDYRITHVF